MPFANILVPIDFSETSRHALRLAIRVAREDNARLTLLHVGGEPRRRHRPAATPSPG